MSNPLESASRTFVDARLDDDAVATLTINRPQSGNALNWALLEQLRSVLADVADLPDVRAIVITAAGGKFVSGADLSFFVRCLASGDMPRIVECIRASQEVFAAIATCRKPVVAAVQGAAVGGGVELALACHRIVATPRASFSFPETGLGIVPSSGGTYRTPRRVGVELTKWLVYTGHLLPPPKALKIGLIDELVMPDQLTSAAKQTALRLCDAAQSETAPPAAAADELALIRSLFATVPVANLRSGPVPDERVSAAAIKSLATRPLSTLEWAERLIDSALGCSPEEGANLALSAVPELFGDPQVHQTLARVAQQQRT